MYYRSSFPSLLILSPVMGDCSESSWKMHAWMLTCEGSRKAHTRKESSIVLPCWGRMSLAAEGAAECVRPCKFSHRGRVCMATTDHSGCVRFVLSCSLLPDFTLQEVSNPDLKFVTAVGSPLGTICSGVTDQSSSFLPRNQLPAMCLGGQQVVTSVLGALPATQET